MSSKAQGLNQDLVTTLGKEADKQMPQGSVASVLSSCTLHRLSPRLYPALPEVSFLLQVCCRLLHHQREENTLLQSGVMQAHCKGWLTVRIPPDPPRFENAVL